MHATMNNTASHPLCRHAYVYAEQFRIFVVRHS